MHPVNQETPIRISNTSCADTDLQGYGWADTMGEGNEVKERGGNRPRRKAGREGRERGGPPLVRCRRRDALSRMEEKKQAYPRHTQKDQKKVSRKTRNIGA